MTRDKQSINYTWRYLVVLTAILLCLAALIWRVAHLTVIQRDFLQEQGDARSIRTIEIPAYRGIVRDRYRIPLAVSTPVTSVWVSPKDFINSQHNLAELTELLDISITDLQKRVGLDSQFVYLKRGIHPTIAEQIEALAIPGIYSQREFRRYYPEGSVTAHLLGFTNIDDRGQEGIELMYDDWLRGVPGKRQVVRNRLGNVIADLGQIKAPSAGYELVLSIDRRIQYLAFRELKNAVEKHQAASGSVVVLDATTGEVLAMVNQPTYNPNKRYKKVDQRYRNRAVTDMIEPGSVMKPFSVAAALQHNYLTSDQVIATSPGWMMLNDNLIKDYRDYGSLNVSQILQHSSNVGIAKIVLDMPADDLVSSLHQAGFGALTDSNFPGENPGALVSPKQWQPFMLATLGFGYGIAVTPLQLAQAYTVFAQQGGLRSVSLLRVDTPQPVQSVFDADVAEHVLAMLENVVEHGTASRAKVPGYRVAGKTGTARIANVGGYDTEAYVATFAGIAPVSDPKLVIVVVINMPQGDEYYGSLVAAPVFSRIMAGVLNLLEIKPDGKG